MLTTLRWAGVGEPLVADVRNREYLCYGEREEGSPPRVLRTFALLGWTPTSLHDLLLSGGTSGARVEEIDSATVVPLLGFDLPDGLGVGNVMHAFERIVLRSSSPLAAAAAALAGFHAHPTWFAELNRALGEGSVWTAALRAASGERERVHDNTHWKGGAVAASATFAHEKSHGPRPQMTGWRVLEEGTGCCPECGAALVLTAKGLRCEQEVRKEQLPPDDSQVEPSEEANEILDLMAAAYANLPENEEE
jgi:hypothetical protein